MSGGISIKKTRILAQAVQYSPKESGTSGTMPVTVVYCYIAILVDWLGGVEWRRPQWGSVNGGPLTWWDEKLPDLWLWSWYL
jgi:hypothetical protein